MKDDEWAVALKERPELKNDTRYITKTATCIITPSKDNYFDNEAILHQFEQLIFLMRFSKIFKEVDYRVDLLVDNATTHT